MLHTTFAKAKEQEACIESYRKMAKSLGGVTKYGKDTPIPLDKILEVCGLQDTIWSLRCTIEPSKNTLIEFACQCAEHVLHFYEDKYPNDNRPRKAIEAARVCITDKSQDAARAARAAWEVAWDAAGAAWDAWEVAWDAARDAAWAAAGAAAGAAARAAARDAAGGAEVKWQTRTLLELLNK